MREICAGTEKKGTKTSAFGSPGRINHDSSSFYASKLYEHVPVNCKVEYIENPVPSCYLDKLLCKSSEQMVELPDNSIHLMVTSPPYNVGKEYDEDLSLAQYRQLLKNVWSEVYRVLVPGVRVCINIVNLGRKPYIPLHSYIIEDMQSLGFLMRGEIIWNKAAGSSPSTAWGSWLSPANPILRDIHEYILVFSKDTFSRKRLLGRESTINKEQFLEYTKSIWTFSAESARRIGHPAPFPIELPYRLIQLYTFKDEIILDPFCGSGSTCIASVKTGRHYIGYDIDEKYINVAKKRIKEYNQQLTISLCVNE
ncbi:MAG: site-specific DNA-methyltransferase [Dehalococcoidales bacterium]|nr:site-specific DNA-methyltransferase [Dehalococcoidales bacterium]